MNGIKLLRPVRLLYRIGIKNTLIKWGKWLGKSRMEFNKSKCKVLHRGRSNSLHKYKIGKSWLGNGHWQKHSDSQYCAVAKRGNIAQDE